MPDVDTRTSTARLRHVRTSPPKVRQVLELIRGQDVDTARDTLTFCERAAARDVGKLLDSAVANAEHNDHIPADELFVVRAHADEGPTLKRWRPRARGRGVRIRKRTSHVTIVLARFGEDALERRRRADATGRRPRRPVRARAAAPREDVEELDEDAALEAAALEAAPEPTEDDADRPAPAKAAKKAPAKKTPTKKKATTAKQPAKKTTAKKTTAKKSTKKSTTAKKSGTTKKAAPRKRGRDEKDDS
jgi:large subunit ribosomal protein L22